jgi:hypothetical protein
MFRYFEEASHVHSVREPREEAVRSWRVISAVAKPSLRFFAVIYILVHRGGLPNETHPIRRPLQFSRVAVLHTAGDLTLVVAIASCSL